MGLPGPPALFVIYIGLAPGLTLRAMDPTLGRVLNEIHTRSAAAGAGETGAPAVTGVSQTAMALRMPTAAPRLAR